MTKVRLVRTCVACPEQYDAYLGNEMIGYLRLRHGHFTVEYQDCGGEMVYEATPIGDGVFDKSERDYHLRWAVHNLLVRHELGPQPKLEAPKVEYEIEGLSYDYEDWPI